MTRDTLELSGRVSDITQKAVRFHISIFQTSDVPIEARGRWLWFPRRKCCLVKIDGHPVLSVSRPYLMQKLAEEGPAAPVRERHSGVA
jgi:hypothetical protein